MEKDKFHVLKNHIPYKAQIVSTYFLSKKYIIRVKNNIYEVAIENTLDIDINSIKTIKYINKFLTI